MRKPFKFSKRDDARCPKDQPVQNYKSDPCLGANIVVRGKQSSLPIQPWVTSENRHNNDTKHIVCVKRLS